MHFFSIIAFVAALFLSDGFARSVFPRDQNATVPVISVAPASAITIMPDGNPYLNVSDTNSTSASDPNLSKRGKTLKILYSNGAFSGSLGSCVSPSGTTTYFTTFNGYVGSPICISAPGTNCMMQADPANKFTVCNKPGCGSESGTKCTNSDNLQLGEPSYMYQILGWDYLYATKGTQSIYFNPNA